MSRSPRHPEGACAIPDEAALATDLTGVEYGYAADQISILLEKKEYMKAGGLASPDDADALALTFAEPVMPRDLIEYLHPTRHPRPDEDGYYLYRDLDSDEDLYRELRED